MLYAFLDESGTHQDAPALCVAGVLFTRTHLDKLQRAWKRELGPLGLSHFHTVDYAQLQGDFRGMDRALADQTYKQLLAVLGRHACGSAGVFCMADPKFNPFANREWGFSPYTACAYACMETLRQIARNLGHPEVTFVIEGGQENAGELGRLLQKRRAADGWKGVEYQFQPKGSGALDTADVLAYEYAKRLKDWDTRNPRKSLTAIVLQHEASDNRIGWLMEQVLVQISRLWSVPA